MLYYKNIIDDAPVPVKIIQMRRAKTKTGEDISRVEISRDMRSTAGFWVNINELINL